MSIMCLKVRVSGYISDAGGKHFLQITRIATSELNYTFLLCFMERVKFPLHMKCKLTYNIITYDIMFFCRNVLEEEVVKPDSPERPEDGYLHRQF